MDFLKQKGFTDLEIKEIIDNNYENVLINLNTNQSNVLEIIDYLLNIGVEKRTIKEIFMYQVGLFFKTKEEIEVSFDEYELESVVKSLNYDPDSVELIDFI